MKKLLWLGVALSLLLANHVQAAYEWRKGTGENVILGTENGSDIDTISYQNIVAPLDRLNSKYRRGAQITYASAATLTVGIGEVCCQKDDGSIRKFRANTTATTVAWADIDAGAEAGSTTYYVYAVADADANTFTCTISTNAATPTGKTYYRRLGSFYNDASSNITLISNDDAYKPQVYDSGWFAVAASNTYTKTHSLGTTKCQITILFSTNSDGSTICAMQGIHWHSANDYGVCMEVLTPTTIQIGVAANGIHILDNSNAEQTYTSGYARILITSLE